MRAATRWAPARNGRRAEGVANGVCTVNPPSLGHQLQATAAQLARRARRRAAPVAPNKPARKCHQQQRQPSRHLPGSQRCGRQRDGLCAAGLRERRVHPARPDHPRADCHAMAAARSRRLCARARRGKLLGSGRGGARVGCAGGGRSLLSASSRAYCSLQPTLRNRIELGLQNQLGISQAFYGQMLR